MLSILAMHMITITFTLREFKHENNSLLRKKSTQEIINDKRTLMVEDEED